MGLAGQGSTFKSLSRMSTNPSSSSAVPWTGVKEAWARGLSSSISIFCSGLRCCLETRGQAVCGLEIMTAPSPGPGAQGPPPSTRLPPKYHQIGGRTRPLGKGFSSAGPFRKGPYGAGMCGLPRHLEDNPFLWARVREVMSTKARGLAPAPCSRAARSLPGARQVGPLELTFSLSSSKLLAAQQPPASPFLQPCSVCELVTLRSTGLWPSSLTWGTARAEG